jgi:hypothetical protein
MSGSMLHYPVHGHILVFQMSTPYTCNSVQMHKHLSLTWPLFFMVASLSATGELICRIPHSLLNTHECGYSVNLSEFPDCFNTLWLAQLHAPLTSYM